MPPIKKISKDDIIKAVLEIIKYENLEDVNARKIAKKLNCSVQPIFYNFGSMDELKKSVFDYIYKIYQDYMIKGSKEEKSYKGLGLSYIKFARDYPNYFKIIFMGKTDLTPELFISNDNMVDEVIKKGMEFTGFNYEEQKKFHLKVWIFTHGLATLSATDTVKISDEEIDILLQETVREMVNGIKEEKNEKYN